MAGEVTATSALVQTRLTSVAGNVDGHVPGAPGVARFEYDCDAFDAPRTTPWGEATADADFLVRAALRDLPPGAEVRWRVEYGPDQADTRFGEPCTFRTLPGAESDAPVSLVVVTGMNYAKFHGEKREYLGPHPERTAGFPALVTIAELAPTAFVGTGDNVYYDKLPVAKTREELRRKWHEQFSAPRFVEMFRTVPTYWEKDDHDHRYNDCDTSGTKAPSSELGIELFREQLPIVDPSTPDAPTFRTHRMSRDLQIWLVEGRDHRSDNKAPDGPDKTLWGAEQLAWLKASVLESDATFRVLISPTPLVGPDDAYKKDNHTNHGGFRHEGRAFLQWVVDHGLHEAGFVVVCGDRHWQYRSVDPLGVEEWSCGALVDANSRIGRSPGDPKSTDPDARIVQPYTQTKRSGGFLHLTVGPSDPGRTARLSGVWRDEHGEVLYETGRVRAVGR